MPHAKCGPVLPWIRNGETDRQTDTPIAIHRTLYRRRSNNKKCKLRKNVSGPEKNRLLSIQEAYTLAEKERACRYLGVLTLHKLRPASSISVVLSWRLSQSDFCRFFKRNVINCCASIAGYQPECVAYSISLIYYTMRTSLRQFTQTATVQCALPPSANTKRSAIPGILRCLFV